MTDQPHYAGLEENTDYLFCPVCKVHVPCLRIDAGGWEVQCPGCEGECGLCDCHLQRYCFGTREEFPPIEHENAVPAAFGSGPRSTETPRTDPESTEPRGET